MYECAFEADDVRNCQSEFFDRYFFPGTDIYRFDALAETQQMYTGISKVIDMQELAQWGAASPQRNMITAIDFCFVNAAHQCWQYMGCMRIKVVVGPIEVCRHGGHKSIAELARARLCVFEGRDLRNCIGFVGWLQCSGQQCLFMQGLRSIPGIYTT
ncbi:hypothetical protein D9M70_517970 [compost metagenome]